MHAQHVTTQTQLSLDANFLTMLAATCECFNLICIHVGYDHRSYERNFSNCV